MKLTSNPYQSFVSDFIRLREEGRRLPLGGFAAAPRPQLDKGAPQVLIFSPHPDDECIIGGLPLRLMREEKMRVANVAVTLGSYRERRAERWTELQAACNFLGFDLISTGAGGLESVRVKTQREQPQHWSDCVNVIQKILKERQPRAIFFPHDDDWNTSHIGTHHLVADALKRLGPSFACQTIETEFWRPMNDPNLSVESNSVDVADLVAAISFHAGEVRRNPYHALLPAWMEDNVRRGAELVGGQGGAAPDFIFATLYRVRRWANGGFQQALPAGRHISASDPVGWLAP